MQTTEGGGQITTWKKVPWNYECDVANVICVNIGSLFLQIGIFIYSPTPSYALLTYLSALHREILFIIYWGYFCFRVFLANITCRPLNAYEYGFLLDLVNLPCSSRYACIHTEDNAWVYFLQLSLIRLLVQIVLPPTCYSLQLRTFTQLNDAPRECLPDACVE